MRESDIDLDEIIGSENGQFEWDSVNFSETAADAEFTIEGGGEVFVLRASLQDKQREWATSDIKFAERVLDVNGGYRFL
ncbi:CVNH domain-containing protein [Aspergillus chevalieri]|uniref:Cyanovirin-N domain-containing protein n=1 Tax=Aspergillus chevalieri TaxID=182096 RepID=A0A7R7ZJA2_ASPCH|nr:uncharacterized protein ACHE_11842S [Aspergillus chevalieri]BCR84440.1 hypothetical protein ACHE_11842S [Aspergillus chevalieri]